MRSPSPHLLLVLALAGCPGPDPTPEPTPTAVVEASPSPTATPTPTPAPVAELHFQPDGRDFTEWEVGAELYVGVHEANLRGTEGTGGEAVGKLDLAATVTILERGAEPTRAAGWRNRWYRVRADHRGTPVEGWIFGALLTPFAWGLEPGGMPIGSFAVIFGRDGRPEARFLATDEDGTSRGLRIHPLTSFSDDGGTLTAMPGAGQDAFPYSLSIGFSLCRDELSCEIVSYQLSGAGDLRQQTRVERPMGAEPSPEYPEGTLTLERTERGRTLATLPVDDLEARCVEQGTLSAPPQPLVRCLIPWAARPMEMAAGHRAVDFVVESESQWRRLAQADDDSSLDRGLAQQGIRVIVDTERSLERGQPPASLLPGGAAAFQLHSVQSWPAEGLSELFLHDELGPVYTTAADGRPGAPWDDHRLYVPTLDGHGWIFEAPHPTAGEVSWEGRAAEPASPGYSARIPLTCDTWTSVVAPALEADGLRQVGTLGEAPVFVPADPGHPLLEQAWGWFGNLPNPPGDWTRGQFHAARPLVLWEDPFGRWVQLMRTDLLPAPGPC